LIAWLNVDVLAVQEAKTDPHTVAKWKELQDNLNRLTHGDWTHQVDGCPNKGRQHVGFVYNRNAVKATLVEPLDSLNPTRSACGGDQRPGFAGYFKFPGGLDLHLVSVHLKSFMDSESYGKRMTALQGLPAAMKTLLEHNPDTDRILLGDFNTLGCEDCSPVVSPEGERDKIKADVAALADPLELRSGATCSHYYEKKPGLLDQVLVSSKLQELPFSTEVQASGLCEVFSCSPFPGAAPQVYREVSDHCPLVIDLVDKDLD
jgi:endonuclease/exonuclease/phosphatase family metal-dependent hydrolase